MPRSRGRGRGGGRGGGGRGRSTPYNGGVHGAFGSGGGPNPFAKPSPPAAGTGKYAHVGFAYASGSGRNSEAVGGGAAEVESEEEEEQVVYDRLEGAFTGLGFSVQHHATSQSPTGALGGSGEAPEEVKAVAEEAEAATAAAALRQRAEAAELRAEVAERQLAAANAALVAAGLLLSPTERIPSVSPPTTETAGSAASVGQADRAVHEAPMPTMDRATAKLSSVRAVASAVGGASEESTEEARHSAADPSAQTTREESGVASGSENDDEAEMDAVWMQAADELMAGSNSDDSDGSLDEEGALEAYMAHCEAEDHVMAPDVDDILARARRRGAAQSSDDDDDDDDDDSEKEESEWETDSQGAEEDDRGGLQQVALHIGGVRVPAGGLSMQAQYPVGRGDARSERDQDRFNVVGKSRHKRMVPGEKARVRAEEMAAKREMRARHKAERNEGSNTVNTAHEESLRKVVDSLNEFVARDGDLWGLPPMPAELLRQARQMASVYGLKTTVQGQGRKQFLLVHKTARAAPPPPAQLEELIQLHVQGASYTANPPLNVPTVLQLASDGHLNPGRIRRMLAKKARRELRAAGLWDEVQDYTMAAMLLGGGGTRKGGKKAKAALNKQGEAKRAKKAKRSARADSPGSQQRAAGGRSPMRPMTFVSVGTVSVDDSTAHIQAPVLAEGSGGRHGFAEADAARTASVQGFGHFEAHTTGFGSRMLAKMGFQGKGAGIGKHENGVSTPVQAEQRGKKLGLGAYK